MSKNEEYILNILLKENIKFIREKTFSDLRKGKYRFDFYLPKYNICLEIDGEPGLDITKRKTKIGDGITPWKDLPYQEDITGNIDVINCGNATI